MNDKQKALAKATPELGHLLGQIDKFYPQLPEPVRAAYDQLGANIKYGCYCDLEPHMEPDGCVLDENRPQDCVYAARLNNKHQCDYWRPITISNSHAEKTPEAP